MELPNKLNESKLKNTLLSKANTKYVKSKWQLQIGLIAGVVLVMEHKRLVIFCSTIIGPQHVSQLPFSHPCCNIQCEMCLI